MRNTVKQLHEIIERWSQKYALSGAIIELPEIYKNPDRYMHHFTDKEQKLLNTISNRKRKVSRIAGRLAARIALQRFDPVNFSEVTAQSIEILNDEYGKPYLTKNNNICISISHSGTCAVAVVSKTRIGVDIELLENRPEIFVSTYFLPSEQQWIRKTGENVVYRVNCLWTRKEAVSKLLGLGGALSFRSIPVLDSESRYEFDSHQIQPYCISLALQKEIAS